ncbi:MAG TPA: response regulator [Magnetospirillaceae bacterium]|nr:response regulator [Magnetospirillaceae bacterium]
MRHTQSGQIVVSLYPAGPYARPFLRCEVEDSGSGVPESVRPSLFTPFTQALSHVTRGGTGLGLAISRLFAELMEGRIGYTPCADSGSVFWFEIPLEAGGDGLPPTFQPVEPPIRVLCVDDHPRARAFLLRTLASFGIQAWEAATGEEALATLRRARVEEDPFQLCLIDQDMPGMDGWRLASNIKSDPVLASTRLVLMTPEGGRRAEAKMKLLDWFGAECPKPVNPMELRDALDMAMSEVPELEAAEDDEATSRGLGTFKEKSILLAEDHPVNQELFSLFLERLGCRVTVASDGIEALEKCGQENFDAVLMDLSMPRMNGYDAVRALRARGYRGPIAAVTASSLQNERDECRAAGMDGVLTKPFKKADLESLLADLFGGSQCAADPAPDKLVLDLGAAVETFLGNHGTVLDLLERFSRKVEGEIPEIQKAAGAGDWEKVRQIAHSIKGAALSLSARKLGDAAAALESESGREDLGLSGIVNLYKAFREFRTAAALAAKQAPPPFGG